MGCLLDITHYELQLLLFGVLICRKYLHLVLQLLQLPNLAMIGPYAYFAFVVALVSADPIRK
jgi:hypothetical protein